ncbi:hypothetical protein [Serratia marcescens]
MSEKPTNNNMQGELANNSRNPPPPPSLAKPAPTPTPPPKGK